jgi:hypothetical protein
VRLVSHFAALYALKFFITTSYLEVWPHNRDETYRDGPKPSQVSLNPKVEGSNPSRPMRKSPA